MANHDIIHELRDLGSNLPVGNTENVYSVPEGYFDGFASAVMKTIRLTEGEFVAGGLPRALPYRVPENYFEGLEERIMDAIRLHPDYRTSREEIEATSPLLSSIGKRPVYSVPQGYFENLQPEFSKPAKGRVLQLGRWVRYAAAAVITGAVVLVGLTVYKNNRTQDPAGKAIARFEKEVKKIEDVGQTQTLIDFMDDGLNVKDVASNGKALKADDVQRLLQDVPVDELKDFNEQSKDIEDVMMTN